MPVTSVSTLNWINLRICAHQVENTLRRLLLVSVLRVEEQTLSSLARPGSDRVSNLRLLTAKVLGEARGWHRLLAEPDVLLGEAKRAATMVSTTMKAINSQYLLLKTRRLVA